MGKVRLINVHKEHIDEDEVLFMIDRTSPLGNPYKITETCNRKSACDMYETYFDALSKCVETNPEIDDRLSQNFKHYLDKIVRTARHTNVALGCHCKPQRCHGQTILNYVKSKLDEQ